MSQASSQLQSSPTRSPRRLEAVSRVTAKAHLAPFESPSDLTRAEKPRASQAQSPSAAPVQHSTAGHFADRGPSQALDGISFCRDLRPGLQFPMLMLHPRAQQCSTVLSSKQSVDQHPCWRLGPATRRGHPGSRKFLKDPTRPRGRSASSASSRRWSPSARRVHEVVGFSDSCRAFNRLVHPVCLWMCQATALTTRIKAES